MNSLMQRSEYTAMYQTEDKLWWYIGLRNVLKFYINRFSVNVPRILDAGCGTGKNIEYLMSLGYRDIEGFDYSPDAIGFCHRRGLELVQQGSILEIKYPDAYFDVVYSMDVLGHLDENDRAVAVSEIFRVLKPGGLFLCNSAALEIFRSQHDEVVNMKSRFTMQEFSRLFDIYNPKILKLSYRVFLLSPPVLLFKLMKKVVQKLNPSQIAKSDQLVFPLGINWFLTQIQLMENLLLRWFNFPFGSSVFIVLRKPL